MPLVRNVANFASDYPMLLDNRGTEAHFVVDTIPFRIFRHSDMTLAF